MTGLVERMFSRGAIPVLENTLAFAETRHRYLVENVANADTPGYRRKDLSKAAFQEILKEAVENRRKDPGRGFQLDRFRALREQNPRESSFGILSDRGLRPPQGVLRHDGNNVDIEKEMASLLRNALESNHAANLLKKLYLQIRLAVTDRSSG